MDMAPAPSNCCQETATLSTNEVDEAVSTAQLLDSTEELCTPAQEGHEAIDESPSTPAETLLVPETVQEQSPTKVMMSLASVAPIFPASNATSWSDDTDDLCFEPIAGKLDLIL